MGSSTPTRPSRSARFRRFGAPLALVAVLALGLTACFPPAEPGAPILSTSTFVAGLNRPWDLAFLPNGIPVYTENDSGQILARMSDADSRHVLGAVSSFDGFSNGGEGGLMGLAIDPDWSVNHRAYACYSTGADNRLASFTLNPPAAITDWKPVITGIPWAGNHDGCRVRFRPGTDELFVSTGDAATGPAPQDDNSLGGKILRVQIQDPGGVVSAVAYPGSAGIPANVSGKLWYTKGHRNPQGLAFRPGTNQVFDDEHGPDRNDEVNLLTNGGNAGWNPTNGSDYDQSKPMTAPGSSINPTWRSGDAVTVAPSGSTFLSGTQWKNWDGALVVACLDGSPDVGQRLLVMHLSADGKSLTGPPVTALKLGVRLRAAVQGPDGNLYVVTDGDSGAPGKGAIWKVTPI